MTVELWALHPPRHKPPTTLIDTFETREAAIEIIDRVNDQAWVETSTGAIRLDDIHRFEIRQP